MVEASGAWLGFSISPVPVIPLWAFSNVDGDIGVVWGGGVGSDLVYLLIEIMYGKSNLPWDDCP